MISKERSKGTPRRDFFENLSREEIESIMQQYSLMRAEMKASNPSWNDEEIERHMVKKVFSFLEATFREQQDVFRDYYPGITDDEIRERIAKGEGFRISSSHSLASIGEELEMLVSLVEERLQEESVAKTVDTQPPDATEPAHTRQAMQPSAKPNLLRRLWAFVRRK